MGYSEPSGTETGPGWTNPIWEMHRRLMWVDSGVQYAQIKEKWGGLRVYLEHSNTRSQVATDIMDDIIESAERQCARLCEVCGAAGEQRHNGGWYKTLCDQHDVRRVSDGS